VFRFGTTAFPRVLIRGKAGATRRVARTAAPESLRVIFQRALTVALPQRDGCNRRDVITTRRFLRGH